jgi:hypothetical protein
MSISFPYEKKIIEEGELADPRIPLQIKTPVGFLTIKFLLDSGADVTTLPFSPYAELFNFKRNQKKKVTIGGIEGGGVNGYPFSLTVRLAKHKFSLRCYFIESRSDPLLGRLDFWNIFSIGFDNKNLRTMLTRF